MNTERPTPETDAAFRDGYTFCAEDMRPAVEFCANLERERDEALAALSGRTVSCSQCNDAAKQLEAMRESTEHLRGLCKGIATALTYPRGSEAQVRCLEEIGGDAAHILKTIKP